MGRREVYKKSGKGSPGSRVCASPPAVAAGFDPNPIALKTPENVDRPSRFAALPPVLSTPPAAAETGPGPVDVGGLFPLRP